MRLGILACFFLLAVSFDAAARTLYSEINRLRLGDGYCAATRNLPPLQPHCLENTGAEPLQVLGVFHPAGSPAAKQAS